MLALVSALRAAEQQNAGSQPVEADAITARTESSPVRSARVLELPPAPTVPAVAETNVPIIHESYGPRYDPPSIDGGDLAPRIVVLMKTASMCGRFDAVTSSVAWNLSRYPHL